MEGAAGVICFESQNYLFVEWFEQGGGVAWQNDDLDIEMGHLQQLGVSKSIVQQHEALDGEVYYYQVPLHLRDETLVEAIHEDGSCYPCLSVGPPKYGMSVLIFALQSRWV